MTSRFSHRVAPVPGLLLALQLVLLLATLAGCAGTPAPPGVFTPTEPWHTSADTISLAPLHGWAFDGLNEQRDRERGDGVLMEAAVQWPGSGRRQTVERFLVEATFLDAASDEVMRANVAFHGEERRRVEIPGTTIFIGWVESTPEGTPSSTAAYAFGVAPEWGTRAGAVEASDESIARALTRDEQRLGFYAYGMSAGILLSNNELCQRLLMKIAARPSLLSIAANFGVEVGVQTSPQQPPVPTRILLGGQRFDGLRQPMQIMANGKPAVLLDVYAVPIRGPLGVTNGIVLIEARHPTDPNRRATLRLAGTRSVELEEGDLPPSTIVGWGDD